MSNITENFRELLPDHTAHIFRVHIKQYSLSESYYQTRVNTFSDIKQYCTFFQSLYQAILTFSEISFLTISESYYQTILIYSELISNSIQTFTELLANNRKHFFESLNAHLNIPKVRKVIHI